MNPLFHYSYTWLLMFLNRWWMSQLHHLVLVSSYWTWIPPQFRYFLAVGVKSVKDFSQCSVLLFFVNFSVLSISYHPHRSNISVTVISLCLILPLSSKEMRTMQTLICIHNLFLIVVREDTLQKQKKCFFFQMVLFDLV